MFVSKGNRDRLPTRFHKFALFRYEDVAYGLCALWFEYCDRFFFNFDLDSKYCDFFHDLEFRLLTIAFSLTVSSQKHGHVTLTVT